MCIAMCIRVRCSRSKARSQRRTLTSNRSTRRVPSPGTTCRVRTVERMPSGMSSTTRHQANINRKLRRAGIRRFNSVHRRFRENPGTHLMVDIRPLPMWKTTCQHRRLMCRKRQSRRPRSSPRSRRRISSATLNIIFPMAAANAYHSRRRSSTSQPSWRRTASLVMSRIKAHIKATTRAFHATIPVAALFQRRPK